MLDHYESGNWGIVMHVPRKWPGWVTEPRWSEQTAKQIAEQRTEDQRNATILRQPNGTTYHAVQNGRTDWVLLQFERLMNRSKQVPERTISDEYRDAAVHP